MKREKCRPTNGTPEDLSGGAEVDWAMRRFGVHAFAEESHVLHLLPHEAAGDADLFAAHHHHFLPVEQLLRHDGREPTQHVVPRVDHHPLRADSRT